MTDPRVIDRRLTVLGQQIRVSVRTGVGVPLVLCNGIGIGLDVLDPLVDHLDADTTVVRFDVPGIGGSANSPAPYGFPYLAGWLGRLLREVRVTGPVDVLGFSWGGALAQQFAFQDPHRCRRLILVSTSTGAIMVPGKPWILAKLLIPQRFPRRHHDEPADDTARDKPQDVNGPMIRPSRSGGRIGYLYQLLAGSVWTSIFALPLIRQDTLIITGTDDPVVPAVNARIMPARCPMPPCT